MQTYDVISVPIANEDGHDNRRRPAVIVSTSKLAQDIGVHWACMITSQENAGQPGDIEIIDLETAGLKHSSVIRPSKMVTVETAEARRIGNLTAPAIERLEGTLKQYLQLVAS